MKWMKMVAGAVLGAYLALYLQPVLADVTVLSYSTAGSGGVTFPLSDATFSVDDNGDGNTFSLDLSGLSTDRVFIAPNFAGSQTFLVTGAASNGQSFAGALVSPSDNEGGYWLGVFNATNNAILQSAAQTPDTAILSVGTTARSWIIAEFGDVGFDFAHAQQTNPTLFIHSANQSTTQWWSVTHNQTNAEYTAGTGGHFFRSVGNLDSGFITYGAGIAHWVLPSTGGLEWSSTSVSTGVADTGLKRLSAGHIQATDAGAGGGSFTVPLKLVAGDGTTKTVDAATTFAATSSYHILACTGAETINTITGGTLGMELTLLNNDSECTIADDDTPTAANAVNLVGTATTDVGAAGKHLFLRHDGNAWQQIGESANN